MVHDSGARVLFTPADPTGAGRGVHQVALTADGLDELADRPSR